MPHDFNAVPQPQPSPADDQIVIELRKGGWALMDKEPDSVTTKEMIEMQTRTRQSLTDGDYASAFSVPMKFVDAWSYEYPTDDPESLGAVHPRDYMLIMAAVGDLVEGFLQPPK